LSLPSNQKQRVVATGTDDVTANDLTYTGKIGVRQRISANSNEQTNHDNDSKTVVLTTPGRTRTCDLRIRNPLLCPTELRAQIPVFVGPHNIQKEKRISDKFSSTLHSTDQYCKKIKGKLCCWCELDL
jgi:hypothetical protein